MLDSALLLLLLAGAPLTLLAGRLRPSWAAGLGAAAALTVACGLGWTWGAGGGTLVDRPWWPSLEARFTLARDALGAPFAIAIAALGGLVITFSAGYMPHHLEKEAAEGRAVRNARAREVHFYAWIVAFMASMVVLALARDLLLLFVALDATALASYFLIAFDREKPEAARAALTTLVVTAGTSLVFLLGVVLVWRAHGTLSLDELRQRGAGVSTLTAFCLAAGVLAKSAQAPLHFWLPRAMAAPTPVSAYLHSAALVASGVFALLRLRFLLAGAPPVLDGLFAVGVVSIAVGSACAIVGDRLKEVLAYSTVAQYGYIVVLIALGGPDGLAGGPLALWVHGLAKCGLFLTAGAVAVGTGADRLSAVGGLARRSPFLAVASLACAASLAGLPGTGGFFKEELFFAAAWRRGALTGIGASIAAALTLAYTARLWCGIFLGPPSAPTTATGRVRLPWTLALPIGALGAASLALGWAWGPLTRLAHAAGLEAANAGALETVPLGYSVAIRPETFSTLGAWAGGAALFFTRGRWETSARRALDAVRRSVSPARWGRAMGSVVAVRARSHETPRDLRSRVVSVLVLATLLVLSVFFVDGLRLHVALDAPSVHDRPIALGLVVTCAATLLAVRARSYLALVVLLSFVGFGLSAVFVFTAAPDVALVAVLVETTLTLLFLIVLSHLPASARAHAERASRRSRPLHAVFAAAAGTTIALVAWSALQRHRDGESVALELVQRAEGAHGSNVVTVILADFRGLDTAGEITVLLLAALGTVAVRWERSA